MGFTAGLVGELDAVGEWGLLTTDADLVITGWNGWLERHGGRSAVAVLGRPILDVFPDLLARKFDRCYRQALGGQIVILSQRFHKYVVPLPPPPTGTAFDHMQQMTRIIPLVDGGAVCGTVTVIEDVTERVAYETELRERVAALREADRRKDEFLATLAHELRNPLAPIQNGLQILRMTVDPDTARGAREMLERQIGQMVRLVNELLDVSRVTTGKITLKRERTDLRSVLDAAVETSRPLIEQGGHELVLRMTADPLPLDADRSRLAQALTNILNNAAKYTPPGGRIVLAAAREAGEVVVRVTDSGIGISTEMLPKVFDLFIQIGQAIDRSQGGLGLGLALVRKLVEMHGGTTAAESPGPGQGSTFTIRLPLARDAERPKESLAPVAGARPPAASRRVLVIDDNVDGAASLAMVLELFGHAVRTVHSGADAVAAARAFNPHIVFLDLGLPGMNGYEVATCFRQEPALRGSVLVALTGWGSEDDKQRTQEAGFDMHLTKPVEAAVLERVLSHLSPVSN